MTHLFHLADFTAPKGSDPKIYKIISEYPTYINLIPRMQKYFPTVILKLIVSNKVDRNEHKMTHLPYLTFEHVKDLFAVTEVYILKIYSERIVYSRLPVTD